MSLASWRLDLGLLDDLVSGSLLDGKKTARDQVVKKMSETKFKKTVRDQVAKKLLPSPPRPSTSSSYQPTSKHRVMYSEDAVPQPTSKFIVSSTPIRNLGPKTTAHNLQALAKLPGKGSAAVKKAVSSSLASSKSDLTNYTAAHKATSSSRPTYKPAAAPAAKAAAQRSS
ncbi:hypothetical protein COO60DRAFT_1464099 [Scenedesmus sp. NREL 46B-D3]|nr:hypothetical protein COO60DRAFT_1464099 [Scenedesmus sp. NREL 46B-D3]